MATNDLERLEAVITPIIMTDSDAVFAYIFGSQVKGTNHARSDVDVAVYYTNIDENARGDQLAVEKQITLALHLEQALKQPVDVVVLNRASIDLRQNVLIHGKLIFSKNEETLTRFKLKHLRQYQDFIMMEPIFRQYRKRRIEEGMFGGRSVDREKVT